MLADCFDEPLVSCAESGERRPAAASRDLADQFGQADQVVGCHCQREVESDPRQAAHLDLGAAGDGLGPAEGLLNELAFP